MKRIFLSLLLITVCHSIFAQKGSITGTLVDSANHKTNIRFATVSIFKGTDTVLTNYKLSDDQGVFRFSNLEVGVKYRLVINAWMYNTLRKEIELTAVQANVNLGTVALAEKRNNLNEVVITSERPPVIVRKDTIEFNAESFKTLPTAVVEDLLKKLPGVAVAADGSIQVNGKNVSRILVDGKEFFGGDQQMATKNLPSNVIDKIAISDDPEAKRRDLDLTEGDIPQVINLKLKKAIKKGAFGKLYAGGGLKELFEAGGIMNIFRDTTQVSVLAYGNNVNKPGFSIGDISRIGGFSRAGINSLNINGDFFSLNGIGFGGTSTGIQESAGAGINFNTLTKKGIKLNGKYFFGQSDNKIGQLVKVDQDLVTDRLLTETGSDTRNKSYNHNFGAKLDWKIDSLTTFSFEPTVTLNLLRNANIDKISSTNASGQMLNTGFNNNAYKADNAEYAVLMSLWKDSKKAGRSFNSSISITKKDNLSDNFNNFLTQFYSPASTQTLDQLRDNDITNFNIFLNTNYAEPLGKKLSLRFAFNGNYIDNENALFTFYQNPLDAAYDIAVPNLSQTVSQSGYKANARINLRWKVTKDLSIQPGIVYNIIGLKNSFTSYPSFNQNYQFFAGSLIINYKAYTFTYTPQFREPDVSYIQPVANNTNQLSIQLGNPNLRPARSHQFGFNLYKYDTKRTMNYSLNANGTIQNDAVIMERTVDAKGAQVNYPVNADGILRFHFNGNLSKDIKNAKRQFTVGTGFFANVGRNLISVNNLTSYARTFQVAPRANGRINLNDKFEFSQNYSLAYNSSSYTNFYPDVQFYVHSAETELVLRWPKKMVWETNYRITHSTQSVGGFNNDVKIWNAGLTLLFMKNDRAQLKFAVNDILNTNIRRWVTISDNAIRDQQYNNLGRHSLMTFTYNIQNFGGKVGGRESLFRF